MNSSHHQAPGPNPSPPTLKALATRAIHSGLLYGRIPRHSLSKLSEANCIVLANTNVLMGVPPTTLFKLEQINPILEHHTHPVWHQIWEHVYLSSRSTCAAVEEDVARSNDEVSYRDLYMKYVALDSAKKSKLHAALLNKASSVKPKHQVQRVSPVVRVPMKNGLLRSIRAQVRRSLPPSKPVVPGNVFPPPPPRSSAPVRPTLRMVAGPKPPLPLSSSGLTAKPPFRPKSVPTLVSDPSDALADHVRRVLQDRKQAKSSSSNALLSKLGIKLL